MMNRTAWLLMLVGAVIFGCKKPDETIPELTPTPTPSSGTTGVPMPPGEGDEDAGHDGHDHEHGEEGAEHAEGDQAAEQTESTEAADAQGGDQQEGDGGEEATSDDSASTISPAGGKFVSTVKLSVPDMMCPYSCYPTVEKALKQVDGIEDVELAQQPEGTPEGEIRERAVVIKVKPGFDPSRAIEALAAANYKASVAN